MTQGPSSRATGPQTNAQENSPVEESSEIDADQLSSDPHMRWTHTLRPRSFTELFTQLGDAEPGPPGSAYREWHPDILGADYLYSVIDLGEDDEGPLEATIVKYQPRSYQRTARAVLYIHGWSDYFFHTETAEFWHGQGASFYAVDLRKYGRSLREGQTPGYTNDLSVYADEISACLAIIREELGTNVRVMLMGHSTGGLTASLWAHHNPGQITGLVLNSPWLEFQGSEFMRVLSQPTLQQLARLNPKAGMPNIDPGFYTRVVSKEFDGEWQYNPEWRPNLSFTVRPGWLSAISSGHAEVARGLDIKVPVLVLAAEKTSIGVRWIEAMRTSDSVLDVDMTVRRAVQLGANVTINRIKDGIHDLALSPRPVRDKYYAAITQWTLAYGWNIL
jgi:alpha-beta hydrolase superfamily lysophospholipase